MSNFLLGTAVKPRRQLRRRATTEPQLGFPRPSSKIIVARLILRLFSFSAHLPVPVVCSSNKAFGSLGSLPCVMNAGELFIILTVPLALSGIWSPEPFRTPSSSKNLLNALLLNCTPLSVTITLGTPYLATIRSRTSFRGVSVVACPPGPTASNSHGKGPTKSAHPVAHGSSGTWVRIIPAACSWLGLYFILPFTVDSLLPTEYESNRRNRSTHNLYCLVFFFNFMHDARCILFVIARRLWR